MRNIMLFTHIRPRTMLTLSLTCALTTEDNRMRSFSLFITTIAALPLSSFELPAQSPAQDDKIAVMHAAALFIKDSLPSGPVLLALEGIPTSSPKGDATARSLNATRGSVHGAIACTVPDTSRRPPMTCSIQGNRVLVEVLYPFVLGNKGRASVKYTSEFRPGRIAFSLWDLELVRDSATGPWRVSKILRRQRS